MDDVMGDRHITHKFKGKVLCTFVTSAHTPRDRSSDRNTAGEGQVCE